MNAPLHQPEPCSPASLSAERGIILIVDDTPDNLALLSDALDDAGYMVLVALDGVSALGRIQRRRPDLILLDAMMPGLDGFETCRRIKAEPNSADIPVLFMTALTDSEHVVQGFEAGGIDYVTKPINPEEVLARVASHLRTSCRLHARRRNPPASASTMLRRMPSYRRASSSPSAKCRCCAGSPAARPTAISATSSASARAR